MTIPADSLPGDHLRAEEKEQVKQTLRRYLNEHSAPISDPYTALLSERLEQCLCVDANDAVCLKAEEMEKCRVAISRFVGRTHPRSNRSMLENFAERLSVLSRSAFPRMIAACCVLLILGNSVALAAANTVPGDTLYPVKVNVLEPARAIFTITPEGKVSWASDRVRRRLAEAERLIAQDRLTTDAWKVLSDSIAENTRIAEEHIIRLSMKQEPKAVDLSADLHVMLNAHGEVFADIAQTEDADAIAKAAADLLAVAAETARLYEQTQQAVDLSDEFVEATAVRAMQSASMTADKLNGVLEESRQSVAERVKERSDIARKLLESAQERLKDGNFRESLNDARMAAQKAEEGNAFLRLGLRFRQADAVSKDASSLQPVPVTVSGATVINVDAAITAPAFSGTSMNRSSSSSKEEEEEAEEQEHGQQGPSSKQVFSSSAFSVQSSTTIVIPPVVPTILP